MNVHLTAGVHLEALAASFFGLPNMHLQLPVRSSQPLSLLPIPRVLERTAAQCLAKCVYQSIYLTFQSPPTQNRTLNPVDSVIAASVALSSCLSRKGRPTCAWFDRVLRLRQGYSISVSCWAFSCSDP